MGNGTKIALGLILLVGMSVGGYLLYEKLQPEVGDKKPEGDKGGTGGSKPADKPEKTDMTQGGEVKKDTPAHGMGLNPTPVGGGAASLGIFPNTVLKRGSGTGNLTTQQQFVKKLQKGLNNLGAGLDEDGKFGAATEAALVKRTGKKTITVGEVESGLKEANLSDNGKAFERGNNFAGIKIR